MGSSRRKKQGRSELMKRILLIVAVAVAGVAQVAHQHHPPGPDEYAQVLEDPQRDSWQKPHEVVMALDLKPTETVADIAAGSGYFTRRFAMHAGKVYAVDIDAKLLELAMKNAPKNVEAVLAAPDDPKLPAASVDTIFFCDVLHHIDGRAAYYPKLAKTLKPGGRIVVIECNAVKTAEAGRTHGGHRVLQEAAAIGAAREHEDFRRRADWRDEGGGLPQDQELRFAALSVLRRSEEHTSELQSL